MTKYEKWINDYQNKEKYILGKCISATKEMAKDFPELKIVKGYVFCDWGKRGHMWCEAPDGKIIDPTAEQFPGPLEYLPWTPGQEVRVGKCMECGSEIWESVEDLDETSPKNFCNSSCEHLFAASL